MYYCDIDNDAEAAKQPEEKQFMSWEDYNDTIQSEDADSIQSLHLSKYNLIIIDVWCNYS